MSFTCFGVHGVFLTKFPTGSISVIDFRQPVPLDKGGTDFGVGSERISLIALIHYTK